MLLTLGLTALTPAIATAQLSSYHQNVSDGQFQREVSARLITGAP